MILLVEDIIDTGRTLERLMDLLRVRRPRSLEICALLHKHIAEHLEHPVRFVGFERRPSSSWVTDSITPRTSVTFRTIASLA